MLCLSPDNYAKYLKCSACFQSSSVIFFKLWIGVNLYHQRSVYSLHNARHSLTQICHTCFHYCSVVLTNCNGNGHIAVLKWKFWYRIPALLFTNHVKKFSFISCQAFSRYNADVSHSLTHFESRIRSCSRPHIDGLLQEKCNSSALAMELRLSCINLSILGTCLES